MLCTSRGLTQRIAGQKAFTLLEVLISIFILVTVLSTVFASYTGTFRIIDETESQAEAYRMARIAVQRIREDLEAVFAYVPKTSTPQSGFGQPEEPPAGGELLSFIGEPNSLRFPTTAHVGFDTEARSDRIAIVSYETREDTEALVAGRYFLNRKDVRLNDLIRDEVTGEPAEEPPAHPVCKNLVKYQSLDGVKFTYYNADDEEDDRWDSTEQEGAFPRKVQVELYFANPSDAQTPFAFTFTVAVHAETASKKDRFS